MSKKDVHVVGTTNEDEPLSLHPKSKHIAPSPTTAAATPVILEHQQISTATIAQPKKAVKKTTSGASSTSTSTKPSKKVESKEDDDDDEDEGDQEEIIPHKVALSSSDDEDEPTPAPTKSNRHPLSPTKSPSGVREKTFLSEVDLEELKPVNFESQPVTDKQKEREAAEAALIAAEAAATYRPRQEWSTDATDHQPTEVFCATWSPDSRFLAVGCGDGSVRVFNASTGKIAYLLRSSATMALGSSSSSGVDESLPITCIRFRPSNEASAKTKNVLIAACADGSITHWHMMSQTCLYSIQEKQDTSDSQIYACDYRRDGEQFATGGRDGKVRLYDESTKALTTTLSAGKDKGTTGHSNRVYVVKYHPQDSNLIISGGWDNTIQIWDARAGHSIRSIYGPHLCGDALDISPDGRTILTGSWRPNETLQRWDLASGNLIDTTSFAAGPGGLGADRPELLYAAAFSPDGSLFAAGGCGTNETKVFTNTTPAKSIERVSMGTGGVYCLAFAPSGKKLAMGGGGPFVTVVDL